MDADTFNQCILRTDVGETKRVAQLRQDIDPIVATHVPQMGTFVPELN